MQGGEMQQVIWDRRVILPAYKAEASKNVLRDEEETDNEFDIGIGSG